MQSTAQKFALDESTWERYRTQHSSSSQKEKVSYTFIPGTPSFTPWQITKKPIAPKSRTAHFPPFEPLIFSPSTTYYPDANPEIRV